MPEGHSIHRLARGLARDFGGRPVRASSPQGRFSDGAARIDGQVLERAEAWGKHLFLHLGTRDVVHVHLGLYGTFLTAPLPAPAPQGALRLRLEGDTSYADLRGPTDCEVLEPAGRRAVLARLGPDPLRRDVGPEPLRRRVTTSRAPIATLLMDQSVVAGVGNIYRAELLFRHRVSPFREGREVPPDVLDAMWEDLRVLMRDGVRRGRIVTVTRADVARLAALDADRPPADDPELDGGDDTLAMRRRRRETGTYVYRREGRPCVRCSTPVAARELSGRRLFWCPGCQV